MYPFPKCTSIAISRATCSGKTFWLYRLLQHKDDTFENPPEKSFVLLWDLPAFVRTNGERTFITFQQGLPSASDLEACHDERWSRDLFVVTERLMKEGILQYKLKDYSGEIVGVVGWCDGAGKTSSTGASYLLG